MKRKVNYVIHTSYLNKLAWAWCRRNLPEGDRRAAWKAKRDEYVELRDAGNLDVEAFHDICLFQYHGITRG